MNAPITITKVLGRAEQGMTKPFLCVAEFSEYYVKGAYAGKNSLCCEWGGNIEHRTPNIERQSGGARRLAEAVLSAHAGHCSLLPANEGRMLR
jgi:hypothetical protein